MNQNNLSTAPKIEKDLGHKNYQSMLSIPVFFPVSILKLIVMSVCTFGIYEIYWYYKNWQFIKERENLDIMPIWRAAFAYFFCYSFFRKVQTTASSLGLTRSIAAEPLALGWIVVALLWLLPDPYSLITHFSVLFLIPVQILANEINAKLSLGHDENGRFTVWNIVAIVFGGMLFLLVVFGTFVPIEEMIFLHAG